MALRPLSDEEKKQYPYFPVPLRELAFIYPEPRKKLFLDMIDEYKKRYPSIKILYAAMNFNAELKADYLLIFEVEINHHNIVMFDVPFCYTNRAIPGYRFYKREKLLDSWFFHSMREMVRMEKGKFLEYINSIGFSIYKEKENYWKKPEVLSELMEKMIFLFLRYNISNR